MNNLMIDVESMSRKSDAAIVSIGAAFFEPETGNIGPTFYRCIDLKSAVDNGVHIEPETVIWWLEQSSEARSAIIAGAVEINLALTNLSEFIANECDLKWVKVWGNGAGFDNIIVRSAFDRSGIECPWQFWHDRDVRTIVDMGRATGFDPKRDMPFTGEVHNALHDAIHQAKYVSAIWQRLVPATSEI